MQPHTPDTARKVSQRSSDDFSIALSSLLVPRADHRRAAFSITIMLFIASLAVFLPGCTVCQNARRTLFSEPSQYSWKADRRHSIKAYRAWADLAWSQQISASSEMPFSCDYEAGFKDGFVDFVYAGGSGEPPPVPPRQYWNLDHRTPQGRAGAEDWFAGFRHGAQVARTDGYREQATIDSSVYSLGPVKSRSSENYYPEGFISEAPYMTGPMEELPLGEPGNEPGQELLESEEMPVQGPIISQPPPDPTPVAPRPESLEESTPRLNLQESWMTSLEVSGQQDLPKPIANPK